MKSTTETKPTKVLLSLCGVDGHDWGIHMVASFLRDAGMEVVYLGMFNMPEGIVRAAVEEDADVIGMSFLAGHHMHFVPKIVQEMKRNGLDDTLLIVGGRIRRQDVPELRAIGVKAVFGAGATSRQIVEYIKDNVRRKPIGKKKRN